MSAKNNNNSDPKNIYESIKPFYYTLKFFGLAPFHINFKNGYMKTTFIDYLTFIVFSCFYSFILYTIFSVASESYSPEGRSILIVGYEAVYNFQFITTFGTFIFNFYMRQKIDGFLKIIAKFDETIELMNWNYKINHVKNYRNLCFWIGINLVTITSIYVMQVLFVTAPQDAMDLFNMFIFTYVAQANLLTVFEFVFSTYCVQSRLDVLSQNAK